MPTDQPGLEMRRLMAKLLAEHGETEVRQDHALPDRERPARLMSLSERHARGPEEHEATR